MRQAKGSYCGDFRQPKEPFVSTPFSGDYASTGGNKLGLRGRAGASRRGARAEDEPEEDDATPRAAPSSTPSSTRRRRRPRPTPTPPDNGDDGTTTP